MLIDKNKLIFVLWEIIVFVPLHTEKENKIILIQTNNIIIIWKSGA